MAQELCIRSPEISSLDKIMSEIQNQPLKVNSHSQVSNFLILTFYVSTISSGKRMSYIKEKKKKSLYELN